MKKKKKKDVRIMDFKEKKYMEKKKDFLQGFMRLSSSLDLSTYSDFEETPGFKMCRYYTISSSVCMSSRTYV